MEKSIEDQFHAAVRVIQGLPKDGQFQASNELKLRFYALYKQASEGPNTTRKPSFYDVVARYKWDAWNRLGDMDREAAMRGYVNELKSIVETMGLSGDVSQFYEAIGPMYEFVDLETGQNINTIVSDSDSELVPHFKNETALITSTTTTNLSEAAGRQQQNSSNGRLPNGKIPNGTAVPNGRIPNGNVPALQSTTYSSRQDVTIDSDGDEFEDTLDAVGTPPTRQVPVIRGDQTTARRSVPDTTTTTAAASLISNISNEIDSEISAALQDLRRSVGALTDRVQSLERRAVREDQRRRSPLPLADLSPASVAFIVAWPLAVHWGISAYRQRQQQARRN